MNWPKAKTIMIIGFLLLDLYLAYLLFYLPRVGMVNATLTETELEALVVLSRHFNVDLAVQPRPLSTRPLPRLAIAEVSLDEITAESLSRLWLGEMAQESKQENGLLFVAGAKQLWLSQVSPYFYTVAYQDDTVVTPLDRFTQEEACDVACDFLTRYLGEDALRHYQVTLAVPDPQQAGAYLIELSRTYKEIPVYLDSYRLSVQNGSVSSFIAKQAVIGEAQRNSLPLVAAEPVVRRYLARLGEPPAEEIVVLDLSLGYSVGIGADDRHELEPVWRFFLAGAETEEVIIPAAHVYWQQPDE